VYDRKESKMDAAMMIMIHRAWVRGHRFIGFGALCFAILVSACKGISSGSHSAQLLTEINPNSCDGTDTERIQLAIAAAKATTNVIHIPYRTPMGAISG
jgi:hypothetical protein